MTNFAIYDNFGERFENYFTKKSFTMNMKDPKNRMFKYFCRGVLIDKRDGFLNLTVNLDQIFKFISETVNSVNQSQSFLSEALQFSENDQFMVKMNLVNEKIDSFSIEVNKDQVHLIPQNNIAILNGFFLAKSKYNTLKISNYKGFGELNISSYSLNLQNEKLISSHNEKQKYQNYTSTFSKVVTGNGLHQEAKLDFLLESENAHFSGDIYKGKCTLFVIDYLADTDYIDIEEMNNDVSYVIY